MHDDPLRCLASYGTLAPGRANHHQLDGLHGQWTTGWVRGHRLETGWGATQGFPALELDPDGPIVPVELFASEDLPRHWARLDAFEGEGYRRVSTVVETDAGPRRASIYAAAVPQPR